MKATESVLLFVLFLLIGFPVLAAPKLKEMSEVELSGAHARDGIALDIELRANANPDGTPFSAAPFNGCSGNNNPCKMALEFAGRAGQWMVLKDYYYVLSYADLYLNAGQTPVSSTSYIELDRFKDHQGNTMLVSPDGQPALEISFPTKPGYQDMKVSLNIGRLAAEYTSNCGGVPGYLCDNATGSALGLRIANQAGQAAGINVDGKVYVYGF